MDILIAIVIGFVCGWIVNYLSDTLPSQHSITRPVCPNCHTGFSWKDYFTLAPCPHCKVPRSWRTYLVLIAAIFISIFFYIFPPSKIGYWLGLPVLVLFGLIVTIDIEHRLILHIVSMAGAVIGLIIGIVLHGVVPTLLGGIAGFGIMILFYYIGTLFAKYRARKLGTDDDEEALGFGDVTLSGILGLLLGWPLIVLGLLVGILAGGAISLLMVLVLVITKRYQPMNVYTAYGPYLIFGAIIILFFPHLIGAAIAR